MSWSITTGISPQDSTRMSHVPCSPDIQTGNRCSPWCFVAKVPWKQVPNDPPGQRISSVGPWDPHDFFSELIMGIMRSTVMGHMGHMYSHLGSWILDYLDSLKVEHCHPLIPYLKNHLKIPGKKKEVDPQEGSIPKRSPESQKCWPNIPCFIIIFLLKLILAKSPILRHPKTIYNPH